MPGLNHLPDHVATAGLVTAILIGTALVARRQIARAADPAVPDGTLTARNAMEIYVEWFTNFADGHPRSEREAVRAALRRAVPVHSARTT